jgi:hypothetical protein
MAGGHDTTPLREVRSSTQRLSHWHTPARRTSSTGRHRAKIRPSTSFGSRSIKRQNFRSLSFAFICSAPLQEQEQRERVVRGHCRNSSPENLHNCSITQRHRNLACVLCDHLHVLLESLTRLGDTRIATAKSTVSKKQRDFWSCSVRVRSLVTTQQQTNRLFHLSTQVHAARFASSKAATVSLPF